MAKLVLVDNYNRESVEDILVEANISEEEAKQKAEEYNKHNSNDCYAVVRSDDYKLWGGISELV